MFTLFYSASGGKKRKYQTQYDDSNGFQENTLHNETVFIKFETYRMGVGDPLGFKKNNSLSRFTGIDSFSCHVTHVRALFQNIGDDRHKA